MMRAMLMITLVWSTGCSAPASSATKAEGKNAESEAKDKKPKASAADHDDETEEHESLPSRVRLAPKVVAAAGIKTAPVVIESLPQTVSLTGELISDPDRTAKITARVAGRITDVFFREGDRVKAGALLAVMESSELARARAGYASAQAKARSARQNLDRLQRVATKGLASGQEIAAAEAEAQTLDSEVRAARQTLLAFGAVAEAGDGARMELRTPVAGFVLSRDAIRGQSVTAEHVAFVVADLEKAYFTARLFEKDVARVKPGATAEVRLNAYPGEVLVGPVEAVGRALDPSSRTVLARIAVKNRSDLLKVGLFGTALVVVPDEIARAPRPVVPFSAITKIGDQDTVFIRQADGDFDVHKVTLGRSAAGKVEIVTGVRVGEQVVTDGVFTLKSAVLKSTFGEED